MRPRRVGLVADDLTGAADSAAEFAVEGWRAHLLWRREARPELGDDGSVLAVVTGVRAAPDGEAAARTAAAVQTLMAGGCERLYVKVDSTLRGSVAGQLRGALSAWTRAHRGAVAVLCPAFPGQGRSVVGGAVLVAGVPVAATAAADDPVTPVVESRVDRLVPGATAIRPRELADSSVGLVDSQVARVVYADASTDDDLARIAAALDGLGPRGVAAGSAGLAGALARRWPNEDGCAPPPFEPADRILVGVSSLHPGARAAVATLRAARATGGKPGRADVDLLTTPGERGDPAAVAREFGERVAERWAREAYDALVVVGGDGAAATLDRIGAATVTLHAPLLPGIPVGTISGGPADGVRIVTTSGGFGDANSLVRIVDRLQCRVEARKEA